MMENNYFLLNTWLLAIYTANYFLFFIRDSLKYWGVAFFWTTYGSIKD